MTDDDQRRRLAVVLGLALAVATVALVAYLAALLWVTG